MSGGFAEIVEPLAASLGIAHARANRLEVADGVLTGRVAGPVVDRAAKAAALREFARAEGVDLADTVAIGDGANDLDMLAAAGLASRSTPSRSGRVVADVALDGRLDAVLDCSTAELRPPARLTGVWRPRVAVSPSAR